MLEFEQDFFLGETREGFYIEPMMKCAWAGQLEVLDAIAWVCNKHNIRWFAAFGTLLGAVRHQGFIPWDDDIDIFMLRADYERFLEVAREELQGDFHIISPHLSDTWIQMFARIVNSLDISYAPERLIPYHGCPYVLGIDIFPLDAVPKSKTDAENQMTLIKALVNSALNCKDNLDEIIPLLPDLENLSGIPIDREKNIDNQLMRATDLVCRRYNKKKLDTIASMFYNVTHTCLMKYEWFRTTEYLDFENVMLPVPGNYEAVLTAMYGDWQTPVKDAAGHNYPFYNKQRSELKERLTNRILRGELL